MTSTVSRSPVFSFRFILFVVAIIGVLPTLAFSGILLLRYANSERERAEHLLIESAKGIASSIDAQFGAIEAALVTLRDSPSLQRDDLVTFEARLRRTAQETGWNFTLIRPDGEQVINTYLAPGKPLPRNDPALWAPILKERRPAVSDIFTGAITGQLLVAVGVPVMDGDAVKWVLVSGLFTKHLASLLQDSGAPEDWIVSIVDRNGRHFVRSRNSEQFAGKPLVPELIDFMKKGESGTIKTTSLEGIPLISTVQFAPKSRWAAAVGLPETSLTGPMHASLLALSLVGLLITAGALVLALLVARILSRSMAELTAAASGVGRGEVVGAPHTAISDANAVGKVLSRASQEIYGLRANLEMQVAQRTEELSATNAHLQEEIQRREESEARIVHMHKIEAIGQLTGGIAHDFNNMLAVVLGSMRLMQRRIDRGDTNVQKYIDGAVEAAERAAKLTSRLLAFSRQQTLAPRAIDVNKLLGNMGEMLRRTIPESAQIETVLAAGVWRIFVDLQALESAIINLVTNARDAMPEGGKITIETANAFLDENYAGTHADVKPGQYVMIAVSDNGTGIPPDVIARVFDPFYTTKPTGQGTGLGLSQVHGFVKQSGGHVSIYSEPGESTTVRLYLARHFGDLAVSPDTRAMSDLPHARGGETVLVVEDDDEVRRLTVEMLQELGYQTVEAANGDEALSKLDGHPEIKLLFTDVVMPGMNGRQLATEAQKRRPDLAVLFTTGYTRNAIVHHGILDPGVHVVIKPHTMEMLAAKIDELLHAREPAK